MNDLISRQAAIDEAEEWIDAVYFEENDKRERKAIRCVIGSLKNMPSADRPQGEVDSVKLYEQAISDLENNKITLGEYEARIEPLKHLYYDRPQGEWVDKAISIIDDMQREGIIDYEQAWEFRMRARMKGVDDEND